MAKRERFTDVSFLRQYPSGDVAEHEVFLSFVNDDDAIAFQEWWHEQGAEVFAFWLKRQEDAAK